MYFIGCLMTNLGKKDLALLGLPDSAQKTKRAVLKCPVNFPKPKMRRNMR